MRNGLIFFFVVVYLSLSAQGITDDFFDGNFNKNPSWTGDSASFRVNASFQLQLYAHGPGLSSPSSNNFGRVYLVSDKSDLKDSLNGYYLQFGEAGSNDAIELFRQQGLQSKSVCRGLGGQIASSFSLGLKITRDSLGLWTIYVDPTGGINYHAQASGIDTLIGGSAFFGVMASYTLTDDTKFYWDDFDVSSVFADHSPPKLTLLRVISSTQLDLQFDQALDLISAGAITNYLAEPSLGHPSVVLIDSQAQGLVHLGFINQVQKNINYSGIKNANGILMKAQTKSFGIFIAGNYDIVINEIMAKPNPTVNLPDCEYIELYNRQAFPINMEGWTLTAGKSSHRLSGIQIQADSFVVLCSASSAIQFGTDLAVYGVIGFPGLKNKGEEISLQNDSGRIISEVNYSETWYKEPYKKAGGWSLEQIDPSNPCGGANNWSESKNADGGTPGRPNSVKALNQDHVPPELIRAYVLSADSICLVFSESLDSSTTLLAIDYQIDNSMVVQSACPVKMEYSRVMLSLKAPLQKGIEYTITVQQHISDCVGNQILVGNSTRVALPDSASYNDVVINEILSDPNSGGVKYVELYNRSGKTIDLRSLLLCSEDSISGTFSDEKSISPSEGYLFFPGDYILLSINGQDVRRQYYSPYPARFLDLASWPKMNIHSGVIALKTKVQGEIDRVSYSASWQFPLLKSTKGVSLEKVNPNSPSNSANSWHSAAESVGFGTPGYLNSQTERNSSSDGISLANELFSPDDDGYQDLLEIDYHFQTPDFVGTITIFDSGGRLVRNLFKNKLLGKDGSFYWDGLAENNEKAPVGIYILCFDIFDASGNINRYRKTCVLAAKL
jgi:hypothetical protein